MSVEEKIKEERLKKLKELEERGINPYPSKVKRTHIISEIIEKYSPVKEGLENVKEEFFIAGRMISRRSFGKACFFHIMDFSGKIQCFIQLPDVGGENYTLFSKNIDIGDILEVGGTLFRTKTGELTLRVMRFKLLSKSLRPLPEKWHGLRDTELRYRQRYLDLIMNRDVVNIFIKRNKIVSFIKDFLKSRGFVEVETPVMHPIPGGARAKPFITHHNALDIPLYLRIAPELYLKRLLVGGFERVYEFARCFRNEGISTVHNPEFTMLEFYIAYADYEYLISLTEELISSLAEVVNVGKRTKFRNNEISLEPPFQKKRFHELLSERLGADEELLNDKEFLTKKCQEHGIAIKGFEEKGALQFLLFEKLVEDTLISPTFVLDYPVEVSPLAKRKEGSPELVERFEFFIGGIEIANAFTELNDPRDQRERFLAQLKEKERGDEEAHPLDEDFLRAIEFGMPPAAGEGIGIDRLTMVLCGVDSVREVLLFPLLKPE
jgi:lysyl-tRNA synthetase class 2